MFRGSHAVNTEKVHYYLNINTLLLLTKDKRERILYFPIYFLGIPKKMKGDVAGTSAPKHISRS